MNWDKKKKVMGILIKTKSRTHCFKLMKQYLLQSRANLYCYILNNICNCNTKRKVFKEVQERDTLHAGRWPWSRWNYLLYFKILRTFGSVSNHLPVLVILLTSFAPLTSIKVTIWETLHRQQKNLERKSYQDHGMDISSQCKNWRCYSLIPEH